MHEVEHHTADFATTRPIVSGTQGVVATGHPLVSMAAMRMLLNGGNAFDAAVAAGFAAAVVEPTASSTLCGECVAMVYDARKRTRNTAFRCTSTCTGWRRASACGGAIAQYDWAGRDVDGFSPPTYPEWR